MDNIDWFKVFPEYQKSLKGDIAYLKKYISFVKSCDDRIVESCRKNIASPDDQDVAIDFWRYFTLGDLPNELAKELSRKERHLRMLSGKISIADTFSENIAMARVVPIDILIEFNRAGFARCIFHNDSTPSMKYYPKDNHVYCFSCQKRADSIDVAMQLYSLGFKDAVSRLCNM